MCPRHFLPNSCEEVNRRLSEFQSRLVHPLCDDDCFCLWQDYDRKSVARKRGCKRVKAAKTETGKKDSTNGPYIKCSAQYVVPPNIHTDFF